jgi:hypothetical protein
MLGGVGLVVARFRAEEPLALLPMLRARTEARLGRRVSLTLEPAIDHFVVRGRTVHVARRDDRWEARLVRSPWWRSGTRAELARIRAALAPLDPSATGDSIAVALGGRHVVRQPPWAYLRSGLRTPVEVEIGTSTLELQAPIVIFGRLYEHATAAAAELAERVPLSASRS